MNIDKLNTEAKREILSKVAKHLQEMSESTYPEEVDSTLRELVDYYLDPLSAEDFFGTEGWEVYFGAYE